jgi:hypothetical protein
VPAAVTADHRCGRLAGPETRCLGAPLCRRAVAPPCARMRVALARGSTVEHLTLDQGVPGSNPGAPANLRTQQGPRNCPEGLVFPGRRRTRRSRAAILVRGQRASEAQLGAMESAIAADERADDARRGESLIGFGLTSWPRFAIAPGGSNNGEDPGPASGHFPIPSVLPRVPGQRKGFPLPTQTPAIRLAGRARHHPVTLAVDVPDPEDLAVQVPCARHGPRIAGA